MWLWTAFVLQLLDNREQSARYGVEAEGRQRELQLGLAAKTKLLVQYLYSKHLEEHASPLFSPQLEVTSDENNSAALGLRSGAKNELEALEVQLSLPSVWWGLSDKGHHLACWYARENWLRLAAWRKAGAKHSTWCKRYRALNWK